MPKKIKTPYPEWFINELANLNDRARAMKGELPTTEEVEFICPKHGTYKQRVSSHIKRSTGEKASGCPKCKIDSISNAQKSRRKTKRVYPDWFINELLLEEQKQKAINGTLSTKDMAVFSCPIHGPYAQIVNNHIVNGKPKSGCPECSNTRLRTFPEWFLKELTLPSDIDKAVAGVLKAHDKVTLSCPVHGDYQKEVKQIINSKGERLEFGCPSCNRSKGSAVGNSKEARQKAVETRKANPDYSEQQRANSLKKSALCVPFPQWFIDDLVYDEDKEKAKNRLLRAHDRVWFNCPKHGPYLQLVNSHILVSNLSPKHGCPKCVVTNQHSSFEDEVSDYIQSLLPLQVKKNTRELIQNPETGRWWEIDIYYPILKLAIECNGSYYHATVGGNLEYSKDPLYHQKKFLECEKKGIHLINLYDVDWYENSDKIKAYLKMLVLKATRYHARDCEVRTVSPKLAKLFENKYHLQGYSTHSSIHLGLFYQGQLLSIMSFGSPRFGYKNYAYELHRYCVKEGVTVLGGAQKLFKKFVETHPGDILSYSDNDYFTGGIYPNLGFKFDGLTTPSYYWYKSHNESCTREQCQPKKLKEMYPDLYEQAEGQGSKEEFIMTSLGYMKVYRAGNKRWVYQNDFLPL